MTPAQPPQLAFTCVTREAAWSPRHGHTCVRFNDRFWLFGGSEHESEDPRAIKGDIWSSADGLDWRLEVDRAPWPERYLHEMVVYHDRIWIFGGMHRYRPDRVNLNDVWCSEDGRHWDQVTEAAPWPPRHVFASAVHDDRMWVLGGAPDGMAYYRDVWGSTDGQHWQQQAREDSWFCPRKNPAATSFSGRLWVIGGFELLRPGEGRPIHDVWCSSGGDAWTRLVAEAPWSARDFPAVVASRDRLWLLGGREDRPDGHVADVWWSTDGTRWHRYPVETPWPRRHCGATVAWDDRIWLFGGCRDGSRQGHFNDVWQMLVEEG